MARSERDLRREAVRRRLGGESAAAQFSVLPLAPDDPHWVRLRRLTTTWPSARRPATWTANHRAPTGEREDILPAKALLPLPLSRGSNRLGVPLPAQSSSLRSVLSRMESDSSPAAPSDALRRLSGSERDTC